MANSVDPDQTAPIGAVCSGSTLFAYILNLSVMLGNYMQQTTSADDIFRYIFFLGALRVKDTHSQYTLDTLTMSLNTIEYNTWMFLRKNNPKFSIFGQVVLHSAINDKNEQIFTNIFFLKFSGFQ